MAKHGTKDEPCLCHCKDVVLRSFKDVFNIERCTVCCCMVGGDGLIKQQKELSK